MQRAIGILLVFFGFILLFAWLIWPTPYYYDQIKMKDNVFPVRINRLTNAADVLYPTGWKNLSNPQHSGRDNSTLETADLAKLEGKAYLDGSWIKARIYNGTEFTVSHIDVQLTVTGLDSLSNFSRRYRLYPGLEGSGKPLSMTEYSANTGEYLYSHPKFEWQILAATGEPSN